MNKVILTGTVYRDAQKFESKYGEDYSPMYFFPMLVEPNGFRDTHTVLRVKVWNRHLDNLAGKLKMGNRIMVIGSVNSYFRNNEDKKYFEYYVIAEKIDLLDRNLDGKLKLEDSFGDEMERQTEQEARAKMEKEENDLPF